MPGTFELHHLSTGWSVALVLGVSALLAAATAAAFAELLRAQALVRSVRRSMRTTGAPLASGVVTLCGVVESPEASPVVLTVRQRAVRQARGTRWQELSRELEASPFHLRLDDGERVLVEPGAGTVLMVPLVKADETGESRSVLGKLLPGDRIHATGTLRTGAAEQDDGGYRGPGRVHRLGPSREAPMRLSTLAFEEEQVGRRNWAVAAVIFTGALLLASQLSAITWFWPLVVTGQRCEGEITQLTLGPGRHAERGVIARVVSCEGAPAGRLSDVALEATVPSEVWPRLAVGERLPFVVARSRPSLHQLGAQPHLELLPSRRLLPILQLVLLAAMLHFAHRHGRPWYEKERVIDAEAERAR